MQRIAPPPVGCRPPSTRATMTTCSAQRPAGQRSGPAQTTTELPYGTLTWLRKEEYAAGQQKGLTAPAAGLPATPKRPTERSQSKAVLSRPPGQATTPLLLARAQVAQAASTTHATGGSQNFAAAALAVAIAAAGCAGLLRRGSRKGSRDAAADVQPRSPAGSRAAAATLLAGPPQQPTPAAAATPPGHAATSDKLQRVPYNEHLVVVEDHTPLSDAEVEELARDILTRNAT